MPTGTVHYEVRPCDTSHIAVLTMDKTPTNPLSALVRAGLREGMTRALADHTVHGVVVCGAHGTFSSGADFTEFGDGHVPDLSVLHTIERSSKPVVAAISGLASGGGYELALSCHHRIASPTSSISLPEVHFGIIPGAGGTQRLPHLVGPTHAIEILCSGQTYSAHHALQLKMIDEIETNVLDVAIHRCASIRGRERRRRGVYEKIVFDEAKKKWSKVRRGENAPMAIIRCVEAACRGGDGMAVEQREFAALITSPQAAAVQHAGFSEKVCWRVPGIQKKHTPNTLHTIGIIGATYIGAHLSIACAKAGFKVHLFDANEEFLENADYHQIKSSNKFSITPSKDYSAFANCDLVIEAGCSEVGRTEMFSSLHEICKPSCIFAINTGRVDDVAQGTSRRREIIGSRVFGLWGENHTPLLENIRGVATSDETIVTVMEFGRRIQFMCILSNGSSFVTDRMLARQGHSLLHQGFLPHEIDSVAETFGAELGPFRMRDLSRLPSDSSDIGLLGEESCGFYEKRGKGETTPKVVSVLQGVWKEAKVVRPDLTKEEVLQRIHFPAINEGFRMLEGGVVSRVSDLDVAAVHGAGFPRWHGGPMMVCYTVAFKKRGFMILSRDRFFIFCCIEQKTTLFSPSRIREFSWNRRKKTGGVLVVTPHP